MTRLWVRTATAHRADKRLSLNAPDFVRAWPSRDTRENVGVLAIADSGECGWSVAFAAGSATILDALEETADRRGVPDVTTGMSRGRKRFLERTPSWNPGNTGDEVGWPSV